MENDQYLLLDDSGPAPPSRCQSLKQAINLRCMKLCFIVTLVAGCIVAIIVLNNHFKSNREPAAAWCESWVRQYQLVPDAVSNCPLSLLNIELVNPSNNHTTQVPYAADMPPANITTSQLPLVSSDAFQSDHRYMFWILDPDSPSRVQPTYRSRVYAYYAEVIGTNPLTFNLTAENVIHRYEPLKPTFGTGPHRYVFLVYDTTDQPYKFPPNSTFPQIGMDVGQFMNVIFGIDMSGALTSGSFFTSECSDLTCL